MPVEIRELVIRAYVEEANGEKAPAQPAGGAEGREDILADCLEQVSEMLRQQQER